MTPLESNIANSRKFGHLLENYQPRGPRELYDRLKAEIKARLPEVTTAQGLKEILRAICTDDSTRLVLAGYSRPQAIVITGMPSMLNAAQQRNVSKVQGLIGQWLRLEIPSLVSYASPNSSWSTEIGGVDALFDKAARSPSSTNSVTFDALAHAKQCVEVIGKIREVLSKHKVPEFSRFGKDGKFGFGQIRRNGAIAMSIELGSVNIQTPWGELTVLSTFGELSTEVQADLKNSFGLQPVKPTMEIQMLAGLGGASYFSITRIPGKAEDLPSAEFLSPHEMCKSEAAQREWKSLVGADASKDISKDVSPLLTKLDKAIESGDDNEQVATLREITNFGVNAAEFIVKYINCSSPKVASAAYDFISSSISDVTVLDAARAHASEFAKLLEGHIDRGEYPTQGYGVVNLIRRIGPAGKELFVPLLIKAAKLHTHPKYGFDCQWECDALGKFGDRSALPLLQEMAACNNSQVRMYAELSIAQIVKANAPQ